MDLSGNVTGLLKLLLDSTLPMLSLIALGYLSRKSNVLKAGDERVLSSYLYYFAIPALFVSNLAGIPVDRASLLLASKALLPMGIILLLLASASRLLRLPAGSFSLMAVSSMFGSAVFFGIPYIMFLFGPGEAEKIATLAAVPVATAGWFVSIIILEFHSAGSTSLKKSAAGAVKKIALNPLIVSMAAGILVSLSGLGMPDFIDRTLGMLKQTASAVAIFMLGMFFHGKRFTGFSDALRLALLRMVLLPAIAMVIYPFTGIGGNVYSVLVLMHGMPAAVNLMVLSERYDFYRDRIPSFLIVSTFGSFFSLMVWTLLTA